MLAPKAWSLVTSTAFLLTATALTASASAQPLMSEDGLWTADIDEFGQLDDLFPPGQGFDRISEARIYEANPDSNQLSRRVDDNYVVTEGPNIDQNQTHAFTRLEKAVGGIPPSGDCCTPHERPGCEDPVCEAAVCDIDCFCCDQNWDEVCVEIAEENPDCDCSPQPSPLSIEIEHFMINGKDGGVLSVIRAISKSKSDPVGVKLFAYVDYDIGSPQDDEATPIFDGGVLAIEQAIFPDQDPIWFGGCPPYSSWEIDEWPLVRDRLDDGVAELKGADHTTPGAADHSCALSSEKVMLGPGESTELLIGQGAPGFGGCPGRACPWDLTGDGSVGIGDLLALFGLWGPCPGPPGCPGDFNSDGAVGVGDLLAMFANWGPCP